MESSDQQQSRMWPALWQNRRKLYQASKKSQVDRTAQCTHTDSSEDNWTVYRDARPCATITYDINPLTTGRNASKCCVHRKAVNSEVRFALTCSATDEIMAKKENHKLSLVTFLVCQKFWKLVLSCKKWDDSLRVHQNGSKKCILWKPYPGQTRNDGKLTSDL